MKKKSTGEGPRIKDPLVLILRNSIRSLNWIHDVYAKDMIQTHAGPMSCFSLWVHTSFAHADLEGLVCLVSSILSGLYSFHLLFHRVPWAWGEGFDRDIQFRTESSKLPHPLHIIWMWVSALFSSAAGSFSDDDWAGQWSMSISQCHWNHFITTFSILGQ